MRTAFGLLILLTGCASEPALKPAPEVVTVVQKVYVPIDASLTGPCLIEARQSDSALESVRVARARRQALMDCNNRMAQIRAVQGTEVQ